MSLIKWIIGSLFLASFLAVVIGNRVGKTVPVSTETVVSENVINKVRIADAEFNYTFFVTDPRKIKLVANFDDKNSSEAISDSNDCEKGINGSFYNQNREPLAGWEANGNVRKNITHNNLLNGYIGLSESNFFWLGREIPEEPMKWGMQAGPVLMTQGKKEVLNMATDKPARRSVAGITSTGQAVMISVFLENSRYDGPTLELLPEVILKINETESLQIDRALNLDGGSASAYYTQTYKLPELIAVGSFLCVN